MSINTSANPKPPWSEFLIAILMPQGIGITNLVDTLADDSSPPRFICHILSTLMFDSPCQYSNRIDLFQTLLNMPPWHVNVLCLKMAFHNGRATECEICAIHSSRSSSVISVCAGRAVKVPAALRCSLSNTHCFGYISPGIIKIMQQNRML